jgi:uncharacterized protein YkwD
MMRRWSIVLALPLFFSLGVAAEGSASACPTQPRARQVRHVQNARMIAVSHRPRVTPAPVAPRAPSAPDAPSASAAASTIAEAHNLARVNEYRTAAGLAPLTLDANLSAFARRGSIQLVSDHVPHGHFRSAGSSMWQQGFTGGAAENQGAPTGWPRAAADPVQNTKKQIDQILASMMAEGPSGGHHRNIMNPKAKRIGIGLVEDGSGKLYLTNDFSE